MSDPKYTKFAVNYLEEELKNIYSYTAYDEANNAVLVIKPKADFGVKIPASIHGTCAANSQLEHSHEITAQQFWAIYKSHVLQLFQYHQEQSKLLETV